MVNLHYPENDLDQPKKLLRLMGSFWADEYSADLFPQSYCKHLLHAWKQVQTDIEETINCIERKTTPIWHTEHWFPLELDERQRQKAALLRYGNAGRYGEGRVYAESTTEAVYPLPAGLVRIPVIHNTTTAPTLTWFHGLDYIVDAEQKTIHFREDPLKHAGVEKQTNFDERGNSFIGGHIWLRQSQWDKAHAYRRWGYQWAYKQPSSPAYLSTLEAAWAALILGASVENIYALLSAILDAPLAAGNETVEAIFRDNRGLCVVTDKQVYRYGAAAQPVVEVGDRVKKGQPLVDVFLPHNCNRGEVPTWLTGLEYPKELLDAGYRAGVVFRNRTETTNVTYDAQGKTVFTFPLGGLPEDVERFWQQMQAKGIASGQTLANLLDQRTNKTQEPTEIALPRTINPAEFLIANVLRNHGLILLLRPNRGGENAQPLVSLQLLQQVFPRHVLLFLIVELDLDAENHFLNVAANLTEPETPLPLGELTDSSAFTAVDDLGNICEPLCN